MPIRLFAATRQLRPRRNGVRRTNQPCSTFQTSAFELVSELPDCVRASHLNVDPSYFRVDGLFGYLFVPLRLHVRPF